MPVTGAFPPLCIDLYAGLGGFSEGFLAEGYRCVGFDIERHQHGEDRYPAQLVLQDCLTLHGSQFRHATILVASPPCQKYSYLAMPWSRSKDLTKSRAAKALRRRWETEGPDNRLFDACFRLQREACEAAGHHIPLIVENVRGAIPWVGRAAWHHGSFFLWGDVPALMPNTRTYKTQGGSWFRERNGEPQPGIRHEDRGVKQGAWFSKEARDAGASARFSSRSSARKAATARIAKIPLNLSQYLAQVFYPRTQCGV